MAEIRGQIVDKPWAENWSRTRVGNVSMEPYHLRTTELLRQQLGEHVGTTVKAAVWVPPVESRDFGVARCAFNLMSAPGDGADKVKRDAVAKSIKEFMQESGCPDFVELNARENSTVCSLKLGSHATKDAFVGGVLQLLEYLDKLLTTWCAEVLPTLQFPERENMTISTNEPEKLFTWVPIQTEAVAKILSLEDNHGELLSALENLENAGLKTMPLNDKITEDTSGRLKDIDPFTFLSNFNRGVTDANRIAMWEALKERWGLKSPVPSDFAGIPLVNTQNSWFLPYRDSKRVSPIYHVLS